jgi:GNAT superfamily N-acetyltransferase
VAEIRPYSPEDEEGVRALASRLVIGAAAWIPAEAMAASIQKWLDDSLAGVAFVAEDSSHIVGFATVSERKHFTGVSEAYVGELAVAADSEGSGIGRALMEAVESWAKTQGLARVSLDTGAANAGARAFYARLGYEEDDVRLSKPIN